nr:hypothetical protein P5652_12120 [Bacillus subtilis]
MTTQLQHLTLPEDIQQKLLSYKEQPISPEFQSLIGTSGYEAEDEAILFDAIIALAMGKNVLLKSTYRFRKNKVGRNIVQLFS